MTQLWTINKIKRLLSDIDTPLPKDEESNIINHFLSFLDNHFKESAFSQKSVRHVNIFDDQSKSTSFRHALGLILQLSDSGVDMFIKETGNQFSDISITNFEGVADSLFDALSKYQQLQANFWDLLQEFIKIDIDESNSSTYSSLARSLLDALRSRGKENDLLAILRKHLRLISQWIPHHFRIDHVFRNSNYAPRIVENTLRAHLSIWEAEYVQEVSRVLDTCILITYRLTPLNGEEFHELLQEFQNSFAFPSLRLGENSQLTASYLRKLQFKLISLFCAAFQFWRVFLPPHKQQDLEAHPLLLCNASSSSSTSLRNKVDNFFKESTNAFLQEQRANSPLFTNELKHLLAFLWQQFETIEDQRIKSQAEKDYLDTQSHRTPTSHDTSHSGSRGKRQIKTSTAIISFDSIKDLFLSLAENALMLPKSVHSSASVSKVTDVNTVTFCQCSIFQEMINILISTQVLTEGQQELNHIDFVLKAVHIGYQGHPLLCESLDAMWEGEDTRFDYPLLRLLQLLLDNSMHGESSLYLWQMLPDLTATTKLRGFWTVSLRRPLAMVTTEPADCLQGRRFASSSAIYEGNEEDDDDEDARQGGLKCRNKLDFSHLDGQELALASISNDGGDENRDEWSRFTVSQQLLDSSRLDPDHDAGGYLGASSAEEAAAHILGSDVRFLGPARYHHVYHHVSWQHHMEDMLHILSAPVEGEVGMLMEIVEREGAYYGCVKWARELDWLKLVVKEIASFLLFFSSSNNRHHHHNRHQDHHPLNGHNHHHHYHQRSDHEIVYPRQCFVTHMLQFLARFDEDILSHVFILQLLNKEWLEFRIAYWIRFYVEDVSDNQMKDIFDLYFQYIPDHAYHFHHDILRSILLHFFPQEVNEHDASAKRIVEDMEMENSVFLKDFGALWARSLTTIVSLEKFQTLSAHVHGKRNSALLDLSLFIQMHPEYSGEIYCVLQQYFPIHHNQANVASHFGEFLSAFQMLSPFKAAENNLLQLQHRIKYIEFVHKLLISMEIVTNANGVITREILVSTLSSVISFVEQEIQAVVACFAANATASVSQDTAGNDGNLAAHRTELLKILLRLGHHVLAVGTRYTPDANNVNNLSSLSNASSLCFSPAILRSLLRIATSIVIAIYLRQQQQVQEQEQALVQQQALPSTKSTNSFGALLRRSSGNDIATSNARDNKNDKMGGNTSPDVGVFVTEGLISAEDLENILMVIRYAMDLLAMLLSLPYMQQPSMKTLWLEMLSESTSRVDWYFGQSDIAASLSNYSSSSTNNAGLLSSAFASSNATNGLNMLTSLLWISTLQSTPYKLSVSLAVRTATLSLLTKLVQVMPQGEQMQSWFVQLVPPHSLSYLQLVISHVLASNTVKEALQAQSEKMTEDVTAGWSFFAELVDNHPIALAMLLAVAEDPSHSNTLIIRTPSLPGAGSMMAMDARFAQFDHVPLAKILPKIFPHIRALYSKDPVFLAAVLAFFQVSFLKALTFPIVAKFVLYLHHQVKNLWEVLASPLLLIDAENGNSIHYRSVDYLVEQFYLAGEEEQKHVWEMSSFESNDEQQRATLYKQTIGYGAVLQHCTSANDMMQMLTQHPSDTETLLTDENMDEDQTRQDKLSKQLLLKRLFHQTGATDQLDTQIRQRNAQTQILIRILDLMARERYGVLYDLDENVGLSTTAQLNAQVYSHAVVRQKCFAGWKKSLLQVSEPPLIVRRQLKRCGGQTTTLLPCYQNMLPHQKLQYSMFNHAENVTDYHGRNLNYDGMYESVYDLSLMAQQCHLWHRLAIVTQGTNDLFSLSSSAVVPWQHLHHSLKTFNAMYIFNVYASASLFDLKRLAGFKHFLQFFIIPGTHIQHNIQRLQTVDEQTTGNHTPSKDNSQPSVGDLSPVTNLPDASPVSAKSSSFAGDKRSYDVITQLMHYMLPSTISTASSSVSFLSSNQEAILLETPPALHPLVNASRCALWMWQERADLLLVMLHHQLHEVDYEDVDPSRSEVHLRQSGNRRMTQSKMETLLKQLLSVFHHWFPNDNTCDITWSSLPPPSSPSVKAVLDMKFPQELYRSENDENLSTKEESAVLSLQILCELWTSMLLLCNGLDAQDTSCEVESSLCKSRQGCFEASFRLLSSLLQKYGVDILIHPPATNNASSNKEHLLYTSANRSDLIFRLAQLALQVLCASLPDTTIVTSSTTRHTSRAKRSISQTDQQRWCQLYETLQVSDFLLLLTAHLEEAVVVCLHNAKQASPSSNMSPSLSSSMQQNERMMTETQQDYGVGNLKVTPDGLKIFDLHFASSNTSNEPFASNNARNRGDIEPNMLSWMLTQASTSLLTALDTAMRSLQAHFLGSEKDKFCLHFLQQSTDLPTMRYYQRYVQTHFDLSIAGIVMAYEVHHGTAGNNVSQLSRIWKRYLQCWETTLVYLKEHMTNAEQRTHIEQRYFPCFSSILSRYMVLWVYPSVSEDSCRMSFEQLALLRYTFRFLGILNDTFPKWYTYGGIKDEEYTGPEQYSSHPVAWLYHILYQRAKVWIARFCLVMMPARDEQTRGTASKRGQSLSANHHTLLHQQERLLSQCVVMRGVEENLLNLSRSMEINQNDSPHYNNGSSKSNVIRSPSSIAGTSSHHVHFGSNEVFHLPKSPDRSSSNGKNTPRSGSGQLNVNNSHTKATKGILKASSESNLFDGDSPHTGTNTTGGHLEDGHDLMDDGVTSYVQEVEEAMLDVFQAMMTVLRQGLFAPFSSTSPENSKFSETNANTEGINKNIDESAWKVKRSFAVGARVFYVASADNGLSHKSSHYTYTQNGHHHHHHTHHHTHHHSKHNIFPQQQQQQQAPVGDTNNTTNIHHQRIYCGIIERVITTGSFSSAHQGEECFYEVHLLDSQSRERISAAQIVYEHAPLCPFVPLKKKLLFKDLFALPPIVSLIMGHYAMTGNETTATDWLSPAVVAAIDMQIRVYISHAPSQYNRTPSLNTSLAISPHLVNHSQHVLALSTAHLLRVLHTIVGSVHSFQQQLHHHQQHHVHSSVPIAGSWAASITAELYGRLRYLQELVGEIVYLLLATLDHHALAPCRQHTAMLQQLQEVRKLWQSTFDASVKDTKATTGNTTLSSGTLVLLSEKKTPFGGVNTSYPSSKLSFADDVADTTATNISKSLFGSGSKKKVLANDEDSITETETEDNGDDHENDLDDVMEALLQQGGRRGLMLRMGSRRLSSSSNSTNNSRSYSGILPATDANASSASGGNDTTAGTSSNRASMSGSFSNLVYDDSDAVSVTSHLHHTPAASTSGTIATPTSSALISTNNSHHTQGTGVSVTAQFVQELERWMEEIALALDMDYRRYHPKHANVPHVVESVMPAQPTTNNKFRQGLRNPVNWVRGNQEF